MCWYYWKGMKKRFISAVYSLHTKLLKKYWLSCLKNEIVIFKDELYENGLLQLLLLGKILEYLYNLQAPDHITQYSLCIYQQNSFINSHFTTDDKNPALDEYLKYSLIMRVMLDLRNSAADAAVT